MMSRVAALFLTVWTTVLIAASPAVGQSDLRADSPLGGDSPLVELLLSQDWTRGEMAMGLLRAMEVAAFEPPDCVPGEEMFTDVPASSPFCPWIEELVRRGLSAGCGDQSFCPTGGVNRQQMAVLLVRSLHAGTSKPGPVVFDPRTEVVETFLDLGEPGFSAGDTVIEHSALVDVETGEGIGRAVTRFQIVEVLEEPDPDNPFGDFVLHLDCTVELEDGNLMFFGAAEFNQIASGMTFALVGGTGTYAGVGGTATVAAVEIGGQEGVTIAFELTR